MDYYWTALSNCVYAACNQSIFNAFGVNNVSFSLPISIWISIHCSVSNTASIYNCLLWSDVVYCLCQIFKAMSDDINVLLSAVCTNYTVFQKSDAKIQITITAAYLIRIYLHLSKFNYRLSGTNVANFNKIHCIVSEQQLFKKGT